MAKYFGVKVIYGLPEYPMEYSSIDLLLRFVENSARLYESDKLSFEFYDDKAYIHPDSLHIFEYKENDLVINGLSKLGLIRLPCEHNNFKEPMLYHMWNNEMVKARGSVIIQRNNLPFVMPNSEEL